MRGGKRVGAGRPKRSTAAGTRELVERASMGGELPIDYMLRVMRDENISSQRRDDMAKAAASYLHGRFRVTEIEANDTDSESMPSSLEGAGIVVETKAPDAVP